MKEFTVLPAPKICLRKNGKGIEIPKTIGNDPVSISDIIQNNKSDMFDFELFHMKLDDLCRRVNIELPDNFDREEGYVLHIVNNMAYFAYDTDKGRFYAIQTLAQIISSCTEECIRETIIVDWPTLRLRGFNLCYHLIDKNMPMFAPDFDMMIKIIKDCACFKMNTVLIEIESMFPFKKYPFLSGDIAFTMDQIKKIRKTCNENHITIIPLWQCLGHAYSVLRYPEFAHLRELPGTTQQYCPCNESARKLYFELVDEIIDAFGPLEYFHIGGDESRRLGKCAKCRKKLFEQGMEALYGDHVNAIGEYILKKGVIPLVWGDIIEHYPAMLNKLDKEIAVVYWNYDITGDKNNRPYVMEKFTSGNRKVLGAGAAKFGKHSDYMFLYKKSMRNMVVMASECTRNAAEGMIVTDWMKITPVEISLIATLYGAQTSWDKPLSQKKFCSDFSRLYFGVRIDSLDYIYRLLSEYSTVKSENMNECYAPPYSEIFEEGMTDFLDRFDRSNRNFTQLLIKYTEQKNVESANEILKNAIENSKKALDIINEYKGKVDINKRIFEVLWLAGFTMSLKSRAGLALNRAVRLLKYPCPNENEKRSCLAAELDNIAAEWEKAPKTLYDILEPGTFREILDTAVEYKFDLKVLEYLNGFSSMLKKGSRMKGLVNMKTYDKGKKYEV